MTHINETYPAAKKEYRCQWCGETIKIKEIHVKQVCVYDGDFQSNRLHSECYEAYFELDYDDAYSSYSMKRGEFKNKFDAE
ncbi:MAG: hypothetical protein AABY07_01325 [Nanoarchaeota archaeon]